MSGIAFILPNADFSGTPLGKVTRKKTPHEVAVEVVNAYSEQIGTSEYNTKLIQLVEELVELNVWENLDVYPILGDTVQKKVINLNPDGFTGENCVVGGNASNGSGCIIFSNTLSMGAVSVEKVSSDILSNDLFVYLDFKFLTNSIYTSRIIDFVRIAGGSGVYMGTALNSGLKLKLAYHSSPSCFSADNVETTRINAVAAVSSENDKLYMVDSGITETSAGETITPYDISNLVGGANGTGSGGESISASSDLFNGELYVFAKGDIPHAKIGDVKTILDHFASGK